MLGNRHDNYLYRSNCRRKYKTAVIAVSHNNCADKTCSNAPAGLMRVDPLIILIRILYIESSCKTVAEIVRSTSLKSLTVVHESLDSICSLSAGKFITVGLSALNNRHCKRILAELRIEIEHTLCLFDSLVSGCMDSMTFLPEELS